MKLGPWEINFSPHLEELGNVLVTDDGNQLKVYWQDTLIAHLVIVEDILSYQGVCRMNLLPGQTFIQLCLDDIEKVIAELN
ncbi:hypothetical protein GTO91_03060 [Heliobacterium undosum]|uniref:Uncharacterized protein n=1 Tax=Heliomicrobium undosum TaxID=121734 RepID=A0A845L4L2_9FIRM|nr:hypothetical protein [Heliomicrobium undosum]MZP28698.1 hypothetical protein [Heliomicrobium undosum]